MKKNEKTTREPNKPNARVYYRIINGRKYLYMDVDIVDGGTGLVIVANDIPISLPFDKKFKLTCKIIHGVPYEE